MTVNPTAAHADQARFNMIEQQIRPWDVLDSDVLRLLGVIRREDFVPSAFSKLAFADMEIPLPGAQQMLAPRLEARMVQDLNLQSSDTVLEIGAGSGFVAALMAHLAHRVLSVEIVPELVAMARANLAKAGIHNVEVRHADGAAQTPMADGPFDAILLSGSVASVPQALLQQLKVGGRLLAIVGDEPVMQATLVKRQSANEFQTKMLWDTVAARLQNFAEPSRFVF